MSFKSDIDITDKENNEDEYIFIDNESYTKLLDDKLLLDSLIAHGVNNWQGWNEAVQYYNYQKGVI